jgi:hypothetical protein
MGWEGQWTPDAVDRFARWVFIDANRLVLSGVVVVGVFALTEALLYADVITVGPESTVKTMFGSGVVSGLFTLITVALTINQLISSRVFGSPNTLRERYQGADELRRSVERVTGGSPGPVDIVAFISLLGEELERLAWRLEERAREPPGDVPEMVSEYVADLSQYASTVSDVSREMEPAAVTSALAGSDYARFVSRTDELVSDHADRLSESAEETLDDVARMMEALAVSRQYFKTITIQQELAALSRHIIFTGLPALLVAFYVTLTYRTSPTSVLDPSLLPLAVGAAIAVVTAPLVVLMVYILRIATIMRYTVSVGPFAPPTEWPWDE